MIKIYLTLLVFLYKEAFYKKKQLETLKEVV